MAHFNDRVQVRVIQPGSSPSARGHGYAGAYAGILAQYSQPLAAASHSDVAPEIDVSTMMDMSHHDATPAIKKDKLISNWHIKKDGMIYQGVEHSSVVVKIEGNVVTTASGNRYVLTNRDPRIKEVMTRIQVAYTHVPMYSSANPLSYPSNLFLLAAEKLCYGELVAKCDNILSNLAEISGRVDLTSTSPISLVSKCTSSRPRDLGLANRPRASARISFSLIVVEHPTRHAIGSRRYALVHEIDDHGWWLPGGGIDDGEDCIQGGARECAEEAGITSFSGPLRLLRVEVTPGRLRWILHGIAASEVLKSTSDKDSQGAVWATTADVLSIQQRNIPQPYLRGPEPAIWFAFLDSERAQSFSFDSIELYTEKGARNRFGRAAYETILEVKIAIRLGTSYICASGAGTLPKISAKDNDILEAVATNLFWRVTHTEDEPTGILGIQAIQRQDGSGNFTVIYFFDCGEGIELQEGFDMTSPDAFIDHFEKKLLLRAHEHGVILPTRVVVHNESDPDTFC